jgi:undecaprenyl-diphosphatase
MNIFQSIVAGIVQGLTEFLPISSSGHLIILPRLFGWQDQGLIFDIFLHLGTLLAILMLFWKDWLGILKGIIFLKNNKYKTDRKLLILIVIGTLPAFIFGFFFGDSIGTNLRLSLVVGINLVFWALVLFAADLYINKRKENILSTKGIKPKQAIIAGLFQAIALIPGGSRSGLSITGGLFAGLNRKVAVKFSFMMSAPIVLGAVFLSGMKAINNPAININWINLTIGLIAAFVSGLLAIKLLNYIANRKSFLPFDIYRIVLGILIIIFL